MEASERASGFGNGELAGLGDALRELGAEARETAARFSESLDLDRRMEESPLAVLGVAAALGIVVGGGLWPLLRPFVKAAARSALSPSNLLAIGAALGALRAARARAPGPIPPSTSSH
jgi:hypothetical protein